jgi:hypothetical protein
VIRIVLRCWILRITELISFIGIIGVICVVRFIRTGSDIRAGLREAGLAYNHISRNHLE